MVYAIIVKNRVRLKTLQIQCKAFESSTIICFIPVIQEQNPSELGVLHADSIVCHINNLYLIQITQGFYRIFLIVWHENFQSPVVVHRSS